MCPWEMTIIYLCMLFITTMDVGRLPVIFVAMHIHPFEEKKAIKFHDHIAY